MSRTAWVGLALAVATVLAVAASLVWGSADLGPGRVWAALVGRGTEVDATIVWALRVPRIVLALAVGGGLAEAYYVDQSPFAHLDTFEELATKNAGRVYEQMEWE